MADPKRLRIQQALTEQLKTITVANGYFNDVGDKVYRGRAFFDYDDGLPMLSLLQPVRAPEALVPPGDGAVYHGPLDLLVQGFAVDDPMNPTDPAERLLADVKRCLHEIIKATSQRPYVWNDITSLRLGPSVCRPPDNEVSSVAYFWLSVSLEFTEHVGDP